MGSVVLLLKSELWNEFKNPISFMIAATALGIIYL